MPSVSDTDSTVSVESCASCVVSAFDMMIEEPRNLDHYREMKES